MGLGVGESRSKKIEESESRGVLGVGGLTKVRAKADDEGDCLVGQFV